MTITDYAAHAGVSDVAIHKRIKSGKIPQRALVREPGKSRPKIDSDIADKAWEQSRNLAQAAGSKANQASNKLAKPAKAKSAGLPPTTVKVEDMSAQGGSSEQVVEKLDFTDDVNRYAKAKTSTEELRSRKLELEIAEKEGTLLDAEETRKTIAKLVNETKESLLNVPAKIGPELLGCTDLVDLEVRLTKAINDALSNLSRLDRVTENG